MPQSELFIPPSKLLYVNKVDLESGWLRVRTEYGDKYLCEFTKLSVKKIVDQRVFFKIEDGTSRGFTASLSLMNAKEYLGIKPPVQSGAKIEIIYSEKKDVKSDARNVIYLQQTANMTVDGISALVTLNTYSDKADVTFTPLPVGTYKVGIPDYPHDRNMTSFYRTKVQPDLKSDQIWFPIEFGDNSRYIHLGNVSHGCVTVMELSKWNAVYKAIIGYRIPASNYVGVISVSNAKK